MTKKKQAVQVQALGFDSAVAAAATELAAYLPRLAPARVRVLPALAALPPDAAADIVLGVSSHLRKLGLGALPPESALDDGLAVIPHGGRLYLAGANPRSVLFAVYRLLEEMGAEFLRPGPGGEVLPCAKALRLPTKPIREQASSRHRGICIEGAPRLEHVLGLLDWMAKKKMNTFQLQFRHSGTFWRRGFLSPELDAGAQAAVPTDADCFALDDRVIAKVRELGMILHRVGHGWTAFVLGLPGYGWVTTGQQPDPDKADWPALVDGKREVWKKVSVNTELCYGRPEIREALVANVLAYAREHSEVDALHIWMSDALNNKCECDKCAAVPATDWYVKIVDEIGHRVKAEGMTMRLVFLGYVDLLWPPVRERITADNVIFMYAPITRCFRHALADGRCGEAAAADRPPLNQYDMPRCNRPYADIMKLWQQQDMPDTFLFDYHMMWAVWRDGMGMDLADVMAADMKDLHALGLNGMVSCQCTRAFYPLPLMPNLMADLLWNRKLAPAARRRQLMKAAFGAHAKAAEDYFAEVQKRVRVGADYAHRTLLDADERSTRVPELNDLAEFAAVQRDAFRRRARAAGDAVGKTSLGMVAVHAEHLAFVAQLHAAAAEQRSRRAATLLRKYERRLPRILAAYHPWIDPLVAAPVREAAQAALDS